MTGKVTNEIIEEKCSGSCSCGWRCPVPVYVENTLTCEMTGEWHTCSHTIGIDCNDGCGKPPQGHDRLWRWFDLSYAGWLTLPRVLMHQMPDGWQYKMAKLLEEWDETWSGEGMPTPYVTGKKKGKFVSWPSFIRNYRHPNKKEIDKIRNKNKA